MDKYYKQEKYKSLYQTCNKKDMRKRIFYGINAVAYHSREYLDKESAVQQLALISSVMEDIESITPRGFLQVFPVDKVYDGEKYSCKDYFFTMEFISGIGMDRKIPSASDFLWDYTNIKARMFLLNKMNVIDYLRRLDGLMPVMSEFMMARGIPSKKLYKDNSGKEFLLGDDGSVTPIIKKRHLKIIK